MSGRRWGFMLVGWAFGVLLCMGVLALLHLWLGEIPTLVPVTLGALLGLAGMDVGQWIYYRARRS